MTSKQHTDSLNQRECHSFEEWKSHYLAVLTEIEKIESLRADSSKLAISLANKSFDELLSAKLKQTLDK